MSDEQHLETFHLPSAGSIPGIPGHHGPGVYVVNWLERTIKRLEDHLAEEAGKSEEKATPAAPVAPATDAPQAPADAPAVEPVQESPAEPTATPAPAEAQPEPPTAPDAAPVAEPAPEEAQPDPSDPAASEAAHD